jgi:hypothetical protein
MRQNVVPNTDIFDWVKAFKIDPAYIGNATLQVCNTSTATLFCPRTCTCKCVFRASFYS